MSSKKLLIVPALVLLVAAGCSSTGNDNENVIDESLLNEAKQPDAKEVTVTLDALNNSGESGTATLTEVDGKTVVTLDLTGAPKGITQPAHIHVGECPGVGAVKYNLTFPKDGKSETTLDVNLETIMSSVPLAINIHKSANDAKTYVACGEITANRD
jgi:Cu/Zn superoxide dismutase